MSLITAQDVAERVRANLDFASASPMSAAKTFYGRRPAAEAAPYVVLSIGEFADPIRESGGVVLQRFGVTLTGWVSDSAFASTMATLIRSWLAAIVAAGNHDWPSGSSLQDVYAVAPGVDDLRIDDRPAGGVDVVMVVFKAVVVVSPPQ